MSARQQLLDELRAEQVQDLDALLAEQLSIRPTPAPAFTGWTPAEQSHHRYVAFRESLAYGQGHDMRKLRSVS